jgi:hypothetical protein
LPYEIVQLNFKKREFVGKPLREVRNTYYPSYSNYAQGRNLNEEISVVKMESANNFIYYPQPSREDKKRIVLIDIKEFYQIEDEIFKEMYYNRHLKSCHRSEFIPHAVL